MSTINQIAHSTYY